MKEFKVSGDCGGQMSILVDDRFRFSLCNIEQNFSIGEAIEIHQKLGQLIATAKRRQAKKKDDC